MELVTKPMLQLVPFITLTMELVTKPMLQLVPSITKILLDGAVFLVHNFLIVTDVDLYLL